MEYSFKTPYRCNCGEPIVETFTMKVRPMGLRRGMGFSDGELTEAEEHSRTHWYPESTGFHCLVCKAVYQKERKGYSINDITNRLRYQSFSLDKVKIVPLSNYRTGTLESFKRMERLVKRMDQSFFIKNERPKKEDHLPTKTRPVIFSGIVWELNTERNPTGHGWQLSGAFSHRLPKNRELVMLRPSMFVKDTELYVINREYFKKLTPRELQLITDIKISEVEKNQTT